MLSRDKFRFLSAVIVMGVSFPILAQNKVVVVPLLGDDGPVYEIGKTGPAGGIVFHITDGGRHGLEAAHEDQGTAVWCNSSADIASIANLFLGNADPNTGQDNTIFMVVAGCSGAALLAYNYEGPNGITGPEGADSWYLPNLDELTLLFSKRAVVGGLTKDYYWSSSETSSSASSHAWGVNFNSGFNVGASLFGPKGDSHGVRVIRDF